MTNARRHHWPHPTAPNYTSLVNRELGMTTLLAANGQKTHFSKLHTLDSTHRRFVYWETHLTACWIPKQCPRIHKRLKWIFYVGQSIINHYVSTGDLWESTMHKQLMIIKYQYYGLYTVMCVVWIPYLAQFAEKYLCLSALCSASEHVFSTSWLICSPRRVCYLPCVPLIFSWANFTNFLEFVLLVLQKNLIVTRNFRLQ